MTEKFKKKGLISKIKTLVAQTGRNIIWRGRPKDNEISELIAQKIQKNSYDFSLLKRKDTFTPPYMALSDQMQIDDDQIFRAAVHNMVNIAIARPRYKGDIQEVLEQYFAQDSMPQSRRDYVRLKLSEIKNNK